VRQSSPFIKDHPAPTIRCPLCGQPIPKEFLQLGLQVDKQALAQLKKEHSGWQVAQIVCPECAWRAAEAARQARNLANLQDEFLLPYPVYAPEETGLLPTPVRINASPQYTGQGINLAFIDSGFYPHPDLTHPHDRILAQIDTTEDRPVEIKVFNPLQASNWHGLMTASIAAGSGAQSDGLYRGVAHQSNLVLVKAGNPYGRGIREVDIERALSWVIAHHERYAIRLVNISLGGDYPPRPGLLSELDCLVEEAIDLGLVVVTASGNSGIERLLPPATAPSAITVGGLDDRNSLDRRLWRMYHSNYGKSSLAQPKPELIAPAIWLAAPMLPHTKTHKEGLRLWRFDHMLETSHRLLTTGGIRRLNGILSVPRLEEKRRQVRLRMIEQKFIHPHYQHVDGTSMAAPVVASVVAQMLEANPSLTPAQVRESLISTAHPLEAVAREVQGAGVLCAPRALASARRMPGGPLNGLPFSPHCQEGRILFSYYDPSHRARRVALVGSFNQWDPKRHILHSPAPGLWQMDLARLAPGSYRYKFFVDETWMSDPENPDRAEDGYGGFSSILEVPE
jgi:serine protease AprX